MSDLGKTTTPVENPKDNAAKVDETKQEESLVGKKEEAEEPSSESKGKGKAKAAEMQTDEEDDDDDDDDDEDDEEDEEEDDDDDLDLDEVDPSDIIPTSTRRSARSGQIDYSSEEALKKAGLASKEGGADTTASSALPADDDDDDFKGDESMDQD